MYQAIAPWTLLSFYAKLSFVLVKQYGRCSREWKRCIAKVKSKFISRKSTHIFSFFVGSSFMESSLLHQRGSLQRTQLSRVGPGHKSSMSVLCHWFPGPHSQALEFGVHISFENFRRPSSRRRCEYKLSKHVAFSNTLEIQIYFLTSLL